MAITCSFTAATPSSADCSSSMRRRKCNCSPEAERKSSPALAKTASASALGVSGSGGGSNPYLAKGKWERKKDGRSGGTSSRFIQVTRTPTVNGPRDAHTSEAHPAPTMPVRERIFWLCAEKHLRTRNSVHEGYWPSPSTILAPCANASLALHT